MTDAPLRPIGQQPGAEVATAAAPDATPVDASPEGGGIGLERLIFFSDAVFAIAITLLVLDVKVPEIPDGQETTALPGRVAELFPNILAYFISFMIIAVFWMGHHATFAYIRRYDRRLLWLNLYLLLFVAFLPFPAALLARYGNTFFAFTFYATFQIVISLLLTAIWIHAARDRRLVDPDLDVTMIHRRFFNGLVPPPVFAASIVVARYSVNLAFAIWTLTALARRSTVKLGDRSKRVMRAVDRLVFRLSP